MSIVNMTDAAELAGVSRSTIWRKAKKGVLSTTTHPDGSPGVDTSELFRVFPPATPAPLQVTLDATPEAALLRQEIKHLNELLAARDRIIEGKDQIIDTQAQALRLLDYKKKEGFFARVFGLK